MEFHGIRTPRKTFHGIPWNLVMEPTSMEFHEIQWNPHTEKKVPWNFWSSMELGSITEFHGILWNKRGAISYDSGSMEFHGIFHGIPWNSAPGKLNVTKFHGIALTFFNWHHGSMEFHVTMQSPNQVSSNTMEYLWDLEGAISKHTRVSLNCLEYSMEFHVTLPPPNQMSPIPWNPWDFLIITFIDIGFPWTSIQYSMELLSWRTICI